MNHIVRPFIARQVENEIILEGNFTPESLTRWIFSQITSTSFHWRNIVSGDNGATWMTVQEMAARRVES